MWFSDNEDKFSQLQYCGPAWFDDFKSTSLLPSRPSRTSQQHWGKGQKIQSDTGFQLRFQIHVFFFNPQYCVLHPVLAPGPLSRIVFQVQTPRIVFQVPVSGSRKVFRFRIRRQVQTSGPVPRIRYQVQVPSRCMLVHHHYSCGLITTLIPATDIGRSLNRPH